MERTHLFDLSELGEVAFHNMEVCQASSCVGFAESRIRVDGRFTLNLVNSAVYGLEIHLQVYSPDHQIQPRAPTASRNWARTEIFLPLNAVDDLINALVHLKKQPVPSRIPPAAAGLK